MKEKFHKFIEKSGVFAQKAADAIARTVVKKRLWFVIAFGVLFIAGIVGYFFVNTNYDSTSYLPDDSEVKQGLSTMYDEFGEGGNASVMITKTENKKKVSVSYADAAEFKSKMLKEDGIANILWLDDLFGGITKDFSDAYTQSEYAECILLLLNIAENLNLSDLAENPILKPIIENIDLSNPSSLESLISNPIFRDFIWNYIGDSYESELASGNYSFDSEKGKQIIISMATDLLTSELLPGTDAGSFSVSEVETMLEEFKSSLDMFYAADSEGNYSPLYQVTFTGSDYADETMKAIDNIRSLADKEGYGVHLSGNAATTYNSIDCVETQTMYALIAVGIVVLVILFMFTTSFWEPVLYLIAIGVAVIINMGSNVIMGSVSYLTSGVAGILQLALSMDYSIFLLTRFKQEKEKTPDVEQAMINAIKASLSPINASSLTTIASFIALMFMSYTIGLDMGIVFTKGVIFSLLSVFMLLPGLAIYTNKLIVKTEHRNFKFTFRKSTGVILKWRKVISGIMLVVIVLGAVGQNFMQFGYGDTATFGSEGSLIYEDKKEIEGVFGSQNQLAVLIKKEVAERSVTTEDGKETTLESVLTNKLAEKEYIITAQSKSVIDESGMSGILPDVFLKQFDNGGEYRRMVTYLDLPEEGKETEKAISEIRAIFSENGVNKGEYYLLGGSSSAIEIKDIVTVDYTVITWVSIVLVMIILFITFRSAILPLLLVFVIQGSVWISMSISVLTGDTLVFIGYMIVSAVMLGATIDYGILLTSNYLEARKNEGKNDAMKKAVAKSSRAILTSSIILCCAGAVIAIMSTMPAIVVFGELIARTAATSLVLVFILLPCLLTLFDKWIAKTTLGGAKFFKEEESQKAVADGATGTVSVNTDTPISEENQSEEIKANVTGEENDTTAPGTLSGVKSDGTNEEADDKDEKEINTGSAEDKDERDEAAASKDTE